MFSSCFRLKTKNLTTYFDLNSRYFFVKNLISSDVISANMASPFRVSGLAQMYSWVRSLPFFHLDERREGAKLTLSMAGAR